MNDGTIVHCDFLGQHKAGMIVGHYFDESWGASYCVNTATAAMLGRTFDRMPGNRVKPTTLDDFNASMQYERNQLESRLVEFEAWTREKFNPFTSDLEHGELVQYGWKDSLWRVGIIIGQCDDVKNGNRILLVRVAHNVSVGQRYDNVPCSPNVKSANLDDLVESMAIERAEMDRVLCRYEADILAGRMPNLCADDEPAPEATP